MIVGALGKLVPESWRSFAFGAGTASGSFGQFLFSPLARALIDSVRLADCAARFRRADAAGRCRSRCVLATPDVGDRRSGKAQPQSYKQALSEAFGHRSYVLLVIGFFTCGFQLAFITVHLPAYLIDRGSERRNRRLDHRRHRAVQHRRLALARAGSRAACPSATSCRSSISPARSRSLPSSRCRRAPRRR